MIKLDKLVVIIIYLLIVLLLSIGVIEFLLWLSKFLMNFFNITKDNSLIIILAVLLTIPIYAFIIAKDKFE